MNRCEYNPHRMVHYRAEGRHARPLCRCKLLPGIRPRMIPRLIGFTLPDPVFADGLRPGGGTCPLCYQQAKSLVNRTPTLAEDGFVSP